MQLQTIGNHKTTDAYSNELDLRIITYHETQVVVFGNDKITLNTGGWRTNTTKARMNQTSNQYNLGYRVFQKDYSWFVEFQGEIIPFEQQTLTLNR